MFSHNSIECRGDVEYLDSPSSFCTVERSSVVENVFWKLQADSNRRSSSVSTLMNTKRMRWLTYPLCLCHAGES
ncbi:hypothetical protein INR49_029146 [Caranx melampygus]|nr:hypothetical protein INR49_029146 [Caranx melampygus]